MLNFTSNPRYIIHYINNTVYYIPGIRCEINTAQTKIVYSYSSSDNRGIEPY